MLTIQQHTLIDKENTEARYKQSLERGIYLFYGKKIAPELFVKPTTIPPRIDKLIRAAIKNSHTSTTIDCAHYKTVMMFRNEVKRDKLEQLTREVVDFYTPKSPEDVVPPCKLCGGPVLCRHYTSKLKRAELLERFGGDIINEYFYCRVCGEPLAYTQNVVYTECRKGVEVPERELDPLYQQINSVSTLIIGTNIKFKYSVSRVKFIENINRVVHNYVNAERERLQRIRTMKLSTVENIVGVYVPIYVFAVLITLSQVKASGVQIISGKSTIDTLPEIFKLAFVRIKSIANIFLSQEPNITVANLKEYLLDAYKRIRGIDFNITPQQGETTENFIIQTPLYRLLYSIARAKNSRIKFGDMSAILGNTDGKFPAGLTTAGVPSSTVVEGVTYTSSLYSDVNDLLQAEADIPRVNIVNEQRKTRRMLSGVSSFGRNQSYSMQEIYCLSGLRHMFKTGKCILCGVDRFGDKNYIIKPDKVTNIERFYQYFSTRCPKGDVHTGKPCDKCGITIEDVATRSPVYYRKHKKTQPRTENKPRLFKFEWSATDKWIQKFANTLEIDIDIVRALGTSEHRDYSSYKKIIGIEERTMRVLHLLDYIEIATILYNQVRYQKYSLQYYEPIKEIVAGISDGKLPTVDKTLPTPDVGKNVWNIYATDGTRDVNLQVNYLLNVFCEIMVFIHDVNKTGAKIAMATWKKISDVEYMYSKLDALTYVMMRSKQQDAVAHYGTETSETSSSSGDSAPEQFVAFGYDAFDLDRDLDDVLEANSD